MGSQASNHFKYELLKGEVDFDVDMFKIMLMRDGFIFEPDDHAILKNIQTNSGAISITFSESAKTITRGSGSFIADGFVIGNQITTNAALNPGPFVITAVEALIITVGETVVDEGPVTKTVTSNDELADGNGYTAGGKELTGVSVDEDDDNNRAEVSWDNAAWTASGGMIGPTPGALIYDDDHANDLIVGYIEFDEDKSVADGGALTVSNIKVRLS